MTRLLAPPALRLRLLLPLLLLLLLAAAVAAPDSAGDAQAASAVMTLRAQLHQAVDRGDLHLAGALLRHLQAATAAAAEAEAEAEAEIETETETETDRRQAAVEVGEGSQRGGLTGESKQRCSGACGARC